MRNRDDTTLEEGSASRSAGSADSAAASSGLVGRRFGRIELLRVIGRGGMGEVYEGFDDKLQRRVAVKAIRAGSRLRAAARSRFLREAQTLSALDDPRICRIYDYIESSKNDLLVLELIDGVTLSERMARPLDRATKLHLSREIVAALEAAHKRGIVHRDVKPGNVMITEQGGVKVLDFGLARSDGQEVEARVGGGDPSGALPDSGVSLLADSDLTWRGEIVGTPRYMSPEQARGESITPASDMFSCGLLIQELFTGRSAYEGVSSTEETLKRAQQGDSDPPSGTASDLARLIGQLKALEPQDRPTAAQAGQRLAYIAGKRRRITQRLLAAAVLLAAIVGAVKYVVDLQRERAESVQAREEAEEVADFLVGLFEVSDPAGSRGNSVTAREILDQGARRIAGELADRPLTQSRMMATIGNVYRALGLYEASQVQLETALATRRRELGPEHVDVARTEYDLGLLHHDRGEYARAESLLRRSYELRLRLLGADDANVATALNGLGLVLHAKGDLEAAEEHYQRALSSSRRVHGPDHPEVARVLYNLGSLQQNLGHYDRAIELYSESQDMLRRAYGERHFEVATLHEGMCVALSLDGDYERAAPRCLESIEIYRQLVGDDHPLIANTMDSLGMVRHSQGDYEAAARLCRDALAMRRRVLGDEHLSVALSLSNLGAALQDLGDLAGAQQALEEAVEMRQKLLGREHLEVAISVENLARLHYARGDLDRSERMVAEVLDIRRTLFGEEHPAVARSLNNLGAIRRARGDYDASEEAYRQSLALSRRLLGSDHVDTAYIELSLARLLLLLEVPDEALALAQQALTTYRERMPAGDLTIADAEDVVGEAQRAVQVAN